MPTPTNSDILIGLYRGFFLRAPDAPGYNDWITKINAGTELSEIAAGFLAHPYAQNNLSYAPESAGGLNDEDFVKAVYKNLLNGTGSEVPTQDEIDYWVGLLSDAENPMSRSDMVLKFVTDSLSIDFTDEEAWPDAAVREAGQNRQYAIIHSNDVAKTFITALGDSTAISEAALTDPNLLAFDPAFQASQKIIAGVTYDPITSNNAKNFITNTAATSENPVNTINSATDEQIFGTGGGVVGQTFTLTINADTIVGLVGSNGTTDNSGDDLIVGTNLTLTSGDNLDGGAGEDVLRVSSNAAAPVNFAAFEMKQVETLQVTADNSNLTFDLSGTQDLETLMSRNSDNGVIFNQVTTLANLTLDNLTGASNATVQYQNSVVAGTADAVTLNVSNTDAGVVTLGRVGDANGGIETVNLSASGADSRIGQLDTDLTTLNFSGDKNIDIAAVLNGTVKTIDASGSTGGGLTVSTNTNNALTFIGGKGDDQITFAGGTLNNKDNVAGGEGNDRLVANQADLIAAKSQISGVEYIRVQDTLVNNIADAANVLDASDFAAATRFELDSGYDNARIDNLKATQQRVDILQDLGGVYGANLGALVIDDGATSAVDDAFTLSLGQDKTDFQAATNTISNIQFVSGEIETLNVISNGDNTDFVENILNVVGGAGNLITLKITGNDDLTLTTAGSKITTVAASDAAGDLDLTGVAYSTTTGAAITTGSGDDIVTGGVKADTVNTGAGDDVVNGSTGADSIALGDGRDEMVYTALAQSSSTETDTIADFVSGQDVVNVAGLGATVFAGTKATFDLAQGALAGGGVVSSVFDASSNRLWVDMNGDGTLDANDFRVNLSGVSALAAADVGLSNVINVIGGVVNDGTAAGDTFTGSSAAIFALGTTINGLGGNDTLIIQDDPAAARSLVGIATGIDNVNIVGGNTVGAITIHNEANVTVTAGGPSIVVLGVAAGQSFNGSTGIDDLTLGAASQTAALGAGNDIVRSTVSNLVDANLDFGAGTADTLEVAPTFGTTVNLTGGAGNTTVAGLEILDLDTANSLVTDVFANISGLTTIVDAVSTNITNNGINQTVNAAALGAGNTLTLLGTANTTVTGLIGAASDVTVAVGAGTTAVQVDVSDASAHTITNNSASKVTITESAGAATGANVVTVAGAGEFAVTSTGGVANGIDLDTTGSTGLVNYVVSGSNSITGAGTGTLNVNATGVAAGGATSLVTAGTQDASINLGESDLTLAGTYAGNLNVTSTAAVAATTQAINTGAGVDTITFTALGAASGATSSTVGTGAGADSLVIGANAVAVTWDGDTAAADVSNVLAGIDVITGFRAGFDTLDVNSVFAGALTGTTSAIATTNANLAANLATAVTTQIAALGAGWTNGDAILVEFQNFNGGQAFFLFTDDDLAGDFTATDTVVQLTGTVGILTAVDIA